MHNDHVNVTPLIDVVMCLIIFFLVCGRLAQQEAGDTITIPTAQLGREINITDHRLTIAVAPAADAAASVSPMLVLNGTRLDALAVPDVLKKAQAADASLQVIIRADEKTPYQFIAPLLDACATANISQVNFSTRE